MKTKALSSKLKLSRNVISNLQSEVVKGGCPSQGVCTGSCICGTGDCPAFTVDDRNACQNKK